MLITPLMSTQLELDIDPDRLITTLAAEAQGRLQSNAADSRYDAVAETIDAHRKQLWTGLTFVELMFLLDTLTERYDIERAYVSEQAREAPYGEADWRDAVRTGYAWHILAAAIRAELDWPAPD